jgi:NAD(P)H dehydrogenase (quinone)
VNLLVCFWTTNLALRRIAGRAELPYSGRARQATGQEYSLDGVLWGRGALVGKVGSVFCSTARQHGGQETTITSFHSTLLHHSMIMVGLPYTFTDLTTMREVTSGTPYGASCVTGAGSQLRMPTALELDMCRYQGEHVARIACRLVAGRDAA